MILNLCRVFIYRNFLTNEECDHFISLVSLFLTLLPLFRSEMSGSFSYANKGHFERK